jgi:PBSX family phage terminase large subunit
MAERVAMSPPELDKKLNILVGPVRSGKTWCLHSKILYLCDYPVAGRRLITGVSKANIKTNVLSDLFDIVGPRSYNYNAQSGELRLFNSEWLVLGAKDEGSEKYLRGATVGCAVCDEIVLMPMTYWQMLLTRLSPPGARLYGSTNPDSPGHWLKKDYIDKPELQDMLAVFNFALSDNPNLDPEYVESLKKMFTGVFHRRMILGEWAVGSGSIYAGAWNDGASLYDDKSRPVGLYGTGGYSDHTISVDVGTTNPQVYLDCIDTGDVAYVDNEYYWDSSKEHRQKTDGEYADDLEAFIKRSNCPMGPKIIVDPSAASFRVELLKRGLWVSGADNDVESYGIRNTASVLATRKMLFHKERTPMCQRELPNYSWSKTRAENGKEQPVKKDDHTPDAVRYLVNELFSKNTWRLNS